jgi:hypothetical protein
MRRDETRDQISNEKIFRKKDIILNKIDLNYVIEPIMSSTFKVINSIK